MSDQPGTDARWARTWRLFHEALDRPVDERPALLDDLCRDDPQVRREVEELLASHDDGLSLLDDSPAVSFIPTELDVGPQVRERILEPGAVLVDRFEIVRLIGLGGMGEVYEAHDRELGNRVAVKTLLPALSQSPAALTRFRKEVLLARQVTHRNACRLFDIFQDDGRVFLTMELLDGETLAARIKREGALDRGEIRQILGQLVAGLEAAHAVGVIHRDLKPSNVLLVEEGSGTRVVITDFGLATSDSDRSVDEAHLTKTGEILGTPAYMAPEQLEGREAHPATDVYALGLMLYEMVTGRPPFTGASSYALASRRLREAAPSPKRHVPDLPHHWETAILRCLERDPEERFDTPRQVLAALDGGSSSRESTPVVSAAGWKWPLAAALVLASALAAWLWWERPATRETSVDVTAPGAEAAERPLLLIADFDNRTGEEALSGVLDAALGRELSGSRLVRVASPQRIADTLRLMERPLDSPLDQSSGEEVALRDGEISLVLSGRVERLGETYLLSAELSRPENGEIVGSPSEEARGTDRILPAIRRLAEDVQATIGRGLSLEESEWRLPAVSTPSLPALKLYAEADRLFIEQGFGGPDRNQAAERLLRNAIAEDPNFASAYLHLAYAIIRQGRSREEALPYAQRAMELRDRASPVERLFIEASHDDFLGSRFRDDPAAARHAEDAVAEYRALLQIDPTHLWAGGNLVGLLESLGRGPEATEVAVQAADRLPNNAWLASMAAWWLVRYEGRIEEAQKYAERGMRLAGDHISDRNRALATSIAHLRSWLVGDVEHLVASLQEEVESAGSLQSDWLRSIRTREVSMYFLDLGMYRRATEVNEIYGSFSADDWNSLLAWRHRDVEHLRETLPREPGQNSVETSGRALDLANVGLADEAEALLAGLPERLDPISRGNVVTARATIDLARGQPRQAIATLEKGLDLLRSQEYLATYFMSAINLSEAWEELGYPERGARVLEEASTQKSRLILGAKFYWMLAELRRAELYRTLGRDAEADGIEADLWNLCSYADEDFPILQELERRRQAVPLG